jgi:aspartyl-tRNA synthetase
LVEEPLRTDHAGELRLDDAGREVSIAGWVASRRDHGGVLFVDVRDASGVVQAVLDPESIAGAERLRDEFCVAISGNVRPRPEGTVNPDLPTGEVEVEASGLRVLSPAEALPFQIDDRADVDELRRLEYRYLDLRRPRMMANLVARSKAVTAMRSTLEEQGFLDVETPTLVRSTPEGARDVLVPSRLRKGAFYALPQSPQLFKQLLMVAGVERYYQIARCYRDEDFRADRQLEFTQLDVEGAFWGRDDVLAALEPVVVAVAKAVRGVEIPVPFPRMTWLEAMMRYGTDKPDIRFGMELVELSSVFSGSEFQAFAGVVSDGGLVVGINSGPREMSRADLDALVERAKGLGAKGLVWMVVEDDGSLRSPIAKFLSDEESGALAEVLEAGPGDVLLLVADEAKIARGVLGAMRVDLGSPPADELAFLWVVDFPVFDATDEGRLVPSHHPFTAPYSVADMREKPAEALSRAYDLVVNGVELGSGSERIHDPDVQRQVFEVLGISETEAESRFGWFMRALRFGTPPHAGFAIGIDRLVMILQGEPNIREVIPFPKTQSGLDPMTASPSPVDEDQLEELGIALRPGVAEALEGDETPD